MFILKYLLSLLLILNSLIMFAQSGAPSTAKSFSELNGTEQFLPQEVQIISPIIVTGLTFYNDRGVFNTTFPFLRVEGFENINISDGDMGIMANPLNYTTSNAYSSPGDIQSGFELSSSITGVADDDIIIIGTGGYLGLTSKLATANYLDQGTVLKFDPPVDFVGFDVFGLMADASCSIDIYDANSNLLVSTSAPCSLAGIFWGVNSSTPISEIILNGTGVGSEAADNIAYGSTSTVPVSNWTIILLFSLITFSVLVRYRKSILQKVR